MEAKAGDDANSCENKFMNLSMKENLEHITKWTSISDVMKTLESLRKLEKKELTLSTKSKNSTCQSWNKLNNNSYVQLKNIVTKVRESLHGTDGSHARCESLQNVLDATLFLTRSTLDYYSFPTKRCNESRKVRAQRARREP